MKGRQLTWVAAFLLIVSLAVWLAFFRNREPTYNGKPLSSWAQTYWTAPNPYSPLDPASIATLNLAASANRREAREAIRSLGTNPIPLMLKWISYERPRWKQFCIDRITRRQISWLTFAVLKWLSLDKGHRYLGNAGACFHALGPKADVQFLISLIKCTKQGPLYSPEMRWPH